jgi:hypothetical protein
VLEHREFRRWCYRGASIQLLRRHEWREWNKAVHARFAIPEVQMPRFFFNILNNGRLQVDQEGVDFATIDEAVEEARIAAREILSEKVLSGDEIDGQRFEITTEDGTIVEVVPFRSVLNLHIHSQE